VLLVSSLFVGTAAAAIRDVTLIAENILWKVGTTTKPTIKVEPGDVLRLTIENKDSFAHTFTFTHFDVDLPLPANAVIFVNITTSGAGTWQFHCAVSGHSTGSGENRDLMVGWVQVGSPPPSFGIGLELILLLVAVIVVIAGVTAYAMRRKK